MNNLDEGRLFGLVDEELRRIENRRRIALERGDSSEYAELCDESGIEPEVPDFYEQGRVGKEPTPQFPRRAYEQTERLGATIAERFRLAGRKLNTATINYNVKANGRDSEGQDYIFTARINFGSGNQLDYTHPFHFRVSHGDRGDLEEDLQDYETQCLAEITDAITRQGRQLGLIVEDSDFADLVVRMRK